MKYLIYTTLILTLIISFSCRKDFTTIDSFGNLSFSKDTVYLDTVFTNIGSSTYNLKVYNKSNNDITVPKIVLENGINSNYRLNVDGIPGKSFSDIDILANDSIYIFIETTIDYNTITNPLYTDKIVFDNGDNKQEVDLVTLVQDATFIYPNRDLISLENDSLTLEGEEKIYGRFLNTDELTFTNEKLYVIYGYVAVPSNEILTINAGANIFFHNNSGLIVDTNASLKINGTITEKVTFQGDRFDLDNSNEPGTDYIAESGQWGTIWLRQGSLNNEINYAQIKNGSIGLLIDNTNASTEPTLIIQNSEIYNNSTYGILARQAYIEGNNLVVANAGVSAFAGISGGNYNFTHCTFASYWNEDVRTSSSVYLSNTSSTFDEDTQELITNTNDLTKANFSNCIIDGDRGSEISIVKDDEISTLFEYNLNNCLIKYDESNNNELINFDNTSNFQNNIINGNPDFKNPILNNFLIGEGSDAINGAISTTISIDLLNTSRTPTIDIGAYQHTVFEED